MSRNYKILILALAVIISLAGGIIGGALVRSYFLNSSFNVPLFGDINLGSQYQGGSLVISKPGKVIVEQDERIYGVIQDVKKNILNFYQKKTLLDVEQNTLPDVARSYYEPEKSVGQAVALTNDGWLITSFNVSALDNYVAIDYEGRVFDIDQVVFDKTSGYFFVKVAAENLAAVQFNEKSDIFDGQLVLNYFEGISDIAYVQKARFISDSPRVKSSEKYYNKIKLNKNNFEAGSLILGLDGSLIGFYEKGGLVTPMYQLERLLPELLSEQKIVRPVFGVNYMNLYDLIGEEELEGILVSKDINGIAVIKDSPADEAGFLLNDAITEVDGRKIGEGNTFSEIIQSRKIGDELELTILRAGEEMKVKVVLD